MDNLTALVLTHNEQENIARSLDSIAWVSQVLIIDSFSTDETLAIAARYPNVKVIQRQFDSFANQCNFGLEQIPTEWVLSLDADYVLSTELASQIRALEPPSDVAGYSVDFRYCIFGQPLRSSLYPARTVLYRRQNARYRDEGHGHRVVIKGLPQKLSAEILHDDRKPLSRWLQSQDQYAKIEAQHLLQTNRNQLNLQDRLRLAIYFAPAVMFFYLLFGRRLILDGWRGWYYVVQRTIAELLLSLRLIEKKKLEMTK